MRRSPRSHSSCSASYFPCGRAWRMSPVLPGQPMRVLSGMRPTGRLHLGHHHGVLENWLKLQTEYECFFFVADWHALTTHYDESQGLQEHVWDMVTDGLPAAGD